MPVTDHGRFDVAIELTEELLRAAAAPVMPPPTPLNQPFSNARMAGNATGTLTLADIDVRASGGGLVQIGGQIAGALLITRATGPDGNNIALPADEVARRVEIDAAISVLITPTVAAFDGPAGPMTAIDLEPATGFLEQVRLQEGAILSSLPVMLLLSAAYLANGRRGYDRARADLLGLIRGAIGAAVRGALDGSDPVRLMPSARPLVLQSVLSTDVSFKVLGRLARPDGRFVGPGGNPGLVSGLTIRRDGLGLALDHLAVVVSNEGLLSDVVLASISERLRNELVSRPDHPCMVTEPVALEIPGMPLREDGVSPLAFVTLTGLAAVLEEGGLVVYMKLRFDVGGSYLSATLDLVYRAGITAAVTPDGAGGAVMTISTTAPTLQHETDITVDQGAYTIALMTGKAGSALVLLFLDFLAGPLIDELARGWVANAIAGLVVSVPFPLPAPFAAMAATPVETAQPGAPRRTIDGFAFDLENDLIVRAL